MLQNKILELTARISLKITANAGWTPPLTMAPRQPRIMKTHSGEFNFMRRVNGALGSFSSS